MPEQLGPQRLQALAEAIVRFQQAGAQEFVQARAEVAGEVSTEDLENALALLSVTADKVDQNLASAQDYVAQTLERVENKDTDFDRTANDVLARIRGQAPPTPVTGAKRATDTDKNPDKPKTEFFTKRAKSSTPDAAVAVMKRWFFANLDHPYPSRAEKASMIEEAGISEKTLRYWFINARRRMLPQLMAAREAYGHDHQQQHSTASLDPSNATPVTQPTVDNSPEDLPQVVTTPDEAEQIHASAQDYAARTLERYEKPSQPSQQDPELLVVPTTPELSTEDVPPPAVEEAAAFIPEPPSVEDGFEAYATDSEGLWDILKVVNPELVAEQETRTAHEAVCDMFAVDMSAIEEDEDHVLAELESLPEVTLGVLETMLMQDDGDYRGM